MLFTWLCCVIFTSGSGLQTENYTLRLPYSVHFKFSTTLLSATRPLTKTSSIRSWGRKGLVFWLIKLLISRRLNVHVNLNSRMIITRDKHKDGKKGKNLGAGCHNNEHPKAGPVFLLFFLCRLSQNLLSKVFTNAHVNGWFTHVKDCLVVLWTTRTFRSHYITESLPGNHNNSPRKKLWVIEQFEWVEINNVCQ